MLATIWAGVRRDRAGFQLFQIHEIHARRSDLRILSLERREKFVWHPHLLLRYNVCRYVEGALVVAGVAKNQTKALRKHKKLDRILFLVCPNYEFRFLH